jgi:hypothetical protein
MTQPMRSCATCSAGFTVTRWNQRYCPAHRTPQRGTTTQRGLGWEHIQRRRQLLAQAYDKPCPLCGNPMLRGQRLDLDHSVPRSMGGRLGDRMAHSRCNSSRGNGTKRTPLIKAMRTTPQLAPRPSRDW